jgi:phage recombination protein Bet
MTTTELALSPASIDTAAFFKPDQVELIKRQIAKNVTHDELSLFLYQCARTGLDPLSRQIYAISRQEWDNDKRCKVQKMSIQTGIDGLRLIADRTGRYSPGPDNEYEYEDKRLIKATATVLKRTADGTWHPVRASAFYSEYAQFKQDGQPTKMWAEKPHIMLGKCAEALALRKAFPAEMSGIYTSDEMGQTEEAPTYIPPKAPPAPPVTEGKGEAPPQSRLHVVPAESGESGPASSISEADEETGEVSSDLVQCWRKVEEGSKKAGTYHSEFVPMDPQPRRNAKQNARIHSLKSQRGLTDEEWPGKLLAEFNKSTSADLSHEEADRLIEMLEDAIKRWGSKSATAAARDARKAQRATEVPPEMTEMLTERAPGEEG